MLAKAIGMGNCDTEHGPITPGGGVQEALDRLKEAEAGSVGQRGLDRAHEAGAGRGLGKERAGWAGF